MKNVICPGFAKSGTTFLHNVFSLNERFLVPIKRKEIKYFLKAKKPDLDDYLSNFIKPTNFTDSSAGSKILFEASPPMMSSGVFKRAKRSLISAKKVVPDAKIVLCIRNPIERAFSRYIHLLDMFSRFGKDRSLKSSVRDTDGKSLFDLQYKNSFPEALSLNTRLNMQLSPMVQLCIDVFGSKNVLLFFLERDANNFPDFYERFCNFLDLDNDHYYDNGSSLMTVGRNEGSSLATYYYGTKIRDDQPLAQGLSDNQFLIATARGDVLIDNVTQEQAQKAFAARDFWTSSIDSEALVELSQSHFKSDIKTLSQIFDKYYPYEKDIPDYANLAPRSKHIKDTLPSTKTRKMLRKSNP
jgi:hypothetical protein